MVTIQTNHHVDFDNIYLRYYPKLVRFASQYVLSVADAENIVQDCFIVIWEQRFTLHTINNINAYIFRLVKNKSVDFLRKKIMAEEKHETIQSEFLKDYNFKLQSIQSFDDAALNDDEIEKIIDNAIKCLPEKCRQIFILSRMECMKYEEIAQHLNISTNTVRNQISLAIKKMKEQLKDYLPLFIFLIS